MTFEVRLSQIQDQAGYTKAVLDHIDALHKFNKTVGVPRPITHPMVEAAIKRIQKPGQPDQYVADYKIIDDTPEQPSEPEPHAPTLEEKKQILVHTVHVLENKAKHKMLPERKMRLAQVKVNLAVSVKEDERTAEQREDIASYMMLQEAWRKLELIGAQAESDIDDLTEDTVDSWQPPTFE